jgi:hypothetical protein
MSVVGVSNNRASSGGAIPRFLQRTRAAAQGLGIEYMDQLMPRLVEERYGPALVKGEQRGIYEFADPVFRAYVKFRKLD